MGFKAKTWAAGTQGVVNDNSSHAAPRVSLFFFPLLDHSYACLREHFSSPLCGVITRLRGSRGRPCLPSTVSELSPWESCVRATGPASAWHVKSGNKLITSETIQFLFQGFGTRKKKKKKLGGHDEGYLKDLAGHVDFLETLD